MKILTVLFLTCWICISTYAQSNEYSGTNAGHGNAGNYNISYGDYAGSNLGSAYGNTLVGYNGGYNITTGDYNVFLGYYSGYYTTYGSYNIGIGYRAGNNNTLGNYNIFIGRYAGYSNTSASYNTVIGDNAARYSVGDNNSIFGANAGNYQDGSNNILVGSKSGYYLQGSGNVLIGNEVGYNLNANNLLLIDNDNVSVPLIYGNFASNQLGINALPDALHTLTVGGSVNASSFYLNGELIEFSSPWETSANNIYYNQGSVGIGTTSPQQQLEIANTSAPATIRLTGDRLNGSNGLIEFYNSSDNNANTLMQLGTWDSHSGAFIVSTGDGVSTAQERFKINSLGNILMGTSSDAGYKLSVNGSIRAKEVNITMNGWADFVFDDDYKLIPLRAVESFLNANKHLPNVPSEGEVVKNGIDLAEMNKVLLQKVEELTLYTIDQEKRIETLEGQLKKLIEK